MWGVSTDYGDSGGVQYDGEQGRDDGGGGGNDPAEGGGGGKHHPKCIGPHCKDETAMYADLFVVAFGVAAVLYLVGGTYFGVQQGKSGIEAVRQQAKTLLRRSILLLRGRTASWVVAADSLCSPRLRPPRSNRSYQTAPSG